MMHTSEAFSKKRNIRNSTIDMAFLGTADEPLIDPKIQMTGAAFWFLPFSWSLLQITPVHSIGKQDAWCLRGTLCGHRPPNALSCCCHTLQQCMLQRCCVMSYMSILLVSFLLDQPLLPSKLENPSSSNNWPSLSQGFQRICLSRLNIADCITL